MFGISDPFSDRFFPYLMPDEKPYRPLNATVQRNDDVLWSREKQLPTHSVREPKFQGCPHQRRNRSTETLASPA
ncbi:hypothetical protein Poly41_63520 [Novipirellula artificiosorum]|uniref:Uncharacterized protein n=1 Tax=Novipirellula artificiosorum TaxID=2528016 RepID=A0A5C6D5Y7_9BACT|nr:hypothetical protein Poly41_63520 [Novipirellula artificiosorum]